MRLCLLHAHCELVAAIHLHREKHLLWIAWHDRDAKCVMQATLSGLSSSPDQAGWLAAFENVMRQQIQRGQRLWGQARKQCLPMYLLTCMVINAHHCPCSWWTSLRGWGRRCIAYLLWSAWASY